MFAKRLITRLVFTTLIATSLFFSSLGTTPVYAAGITVDTDVDETTTNGLCSLREAIINANNNAVTYPDCAAGLEADTITFAGNYTITLVGEQLPVVTSEIIINGNGAANTIIQANANPNTATYRVFSAIFGHLTLDNLTVRHGRCNGACSGEGKRKYQAGGIFNDGGSLTVSNSIITGNSVTPDSNGHYGDGGGIGGNGNMNLINSTISGNSASRGGGIFIDYDAIVTITNSSISGNSARGGGGILSEGLSTLTITNSTIQENRASGLGGDGGGIYTGSFPTMITNSTISGNSASHSGGGIFNRTTLTMTNSTLYRNSAFFGGGVYNEGTLTLTNDTLFRNSADTGGGLALFYGQLSYFNTIIASYTGGMSGGDCYQHQGTIVANSNNLVEDGGCSAALSGDPKLGELADNGGATQTVALLAGSPAIDAGDDTLCANSPINNLDQRGVTRPQGAHCDIGAFEYEYESDTTPPSVLSITRTGSSPSNASSVNFTVTFSESVTGVDYGDFPLSTMGVSGASIASVSGSEATYTVTVNTGSGNGTIRLDVVDNDSIVDGAGNPLGGVGAGNGNFSSGEVYDIQKNQAPTDIQLSAATVAENLPAGTTVGTLTTIDPEAGDTHTYSFCGGADDASFALAGNALNTARMFDYEVQNTFNICIRSTDAGGRFLDKAFQILVQDVAENPAPSNNDFANATIVPSLPFDDMVDTTGATEQAGEQEPVCANGYFINTVWYRFTSTTRIAVAPTATADFPLAYTLYTGNSLDSLTPKNSSCSPAGGTVGSGFIAEPNTTYYFQLGTWGVAAGGAVHFHLETIPPPQAAFSFSPANPSIFDNIQFSDATPNWNIINPSGVNAFTWDFGDGTTSTLEDPTHQYLTDGDYTVQHTMTTNGFTTSTSQVIQVRTHDVAITKVVAPSSGNVGQTRPITVYIKNNRYAETVQIQLYKSNPNVAGGFELVGSYIQFVPVRSGNRTSAFTFNYTFTSADLSVGKVTFKAVATLVNGHDAIPSDNELSSSPPTLVRR